MYYYYYYCEQIDKLATELLCCCIACMEHAVNRPTAEIDARFAVNYKSIPVCLCI